ncbi:MAG: HNH endonuclease [Pirellula sp.]|nr:HNH endonuclease [Pirellula sp.]
MREFKRTMQRSRKWKQERPNKSTITPPIKEMRRNRHGCVSLLPCPYTRVRQLRFSRLYYRVTTMGGASIIDAAHIHQLSASRNNDPKNGIALCKNTHWMFDQGLWSLDEDYRIIVSHDSCEEEAHNQKSLRVFQGSRIALPSNPKLWPDPHHLAWHREFKFSA